MDLVIDNGQIIASINNEHSLSLLELRNMVQEISQQIVNCIGWELSCSYTVEISAASGPETASATGLQLCGLDVRIPPLARLKRTAETQSILNWILLDDSGELRPLHRALGDIRQAALQPYDTPFHCFRAIEALMYYFDRNPRRGRPRLCEALQIADPWIIERLEKPGGMLRHGGVRSVSDDERSETITAAAESDLPIYLRRRSLTLLPEGEFPTLSV